MLNLVHNFWVISCIALTFFILINNPKSQGVGSQNVIFGGTRTAQENLSKTIWILVVLFFGFALVLSILM
jgi:protein translocase SecG subunit